MRPLESLLPYIEGRVAAQGDAGSAGRVARFDNDVYFRPAVLPGPEYHEESLRFHFHLFFAEDGFHAAPAFPLLESLLRIHLGYDLSFPGGILGDPLVRQELQRLRQAWGWRDPFLTVTRVKVPGPELSEAPPCWASLGMNPRPDRRAPPDGYNWEVLGSEIRNSADEILRLLEMSRPRGPTTRSRSP